MAYWIWNFFLTLSFTLTLPFLPVLLLLGRRFRAGFFQRLGFYPREVREAIRGSRPIWIHAVSVGEVLAARRLAEEVRQRFPGRKMVLSTFTSTGHEVARQEGAADIVIFLPLDHSWIVRRALDLLDPSLLIFLETEIWPNLLHGAYRRGIPALLLSGRLSPRAFRRYSLLRPFFSRAVRQFTALGMQSEDDARRMIRLGVDPQKVWITGNLKHSSLEDDGPGPKEWMDEERAAVGRQVLVVGSTHKGEEEVLLDAFLTLKARFPDLLMVLAPRHPQRFSEVERMLQKKNVSYEKKSQWNGRETRAADVIFLDTIGDLPSFYSLADVAFVGGSLVDAGGHNLLEPARFRKPILFGPYMTNFRELAEEMKRKGGGMEVRGKEDLVREIAGLLTDRSRADRMGDVAYNVVEGDRGVTERTLGLVSRYLPL